MQSSKGLTCNWNGSFNNRIKSIKFWSNEPTTPLYVALCWRAQDHANIMSWTCDPYPPGYNFVYPQVSLGSEETLYTSIDTGFLLISLIMMVSVVSRQLAATIHKNVVLFVWGIVYGRLFHVFNRILSKVIRWSRRSLSQRSRVWFAYFLDGYRYQFVTFSVPIGTNQITLTYEYELSNEYDLLLFQKSSHFFTRRHTFVLKILLHVNTINQLGCFH